MNDALTVRIGLELVGHEAIVREWYLDSENVGTWGVGVTDKSGHKVARYKDNPQTVEKCLEIYVWLLRSQYMPDVLKAFQGFKLTETQLAAALSFHYNTGAILSTKWVALWEGLDFKGSRVFLENHYLNGGALKSRRMKEAALFFDGEWSQDGKATIYPVLKPSYRPDFRHPKQVDITVDMEKALGV